MGEAFCEKEILEQTSRRVTRSARREGQVHGKAAGLNCDGEDSLCVIAILRNVGSHQ